MSLKKLNGWQMAGVVAGLGCLSILGVLVIGLVAAAVWARSTLAEFGDTTATRIERTVPLAAPAADPSTGVGSAPVAGERLRLTLDLQEGSFDIRPGAAGEQLRVEGTWVTTLYELTEDRQSTDSGTPAATIRFRSRAPAWARAVAELTGGDSAGSPRVTVLIPPDVPLDLSLRVAMGESRIDLGGLTLGELDLDLTMGEHRVNFAEPVVNALPRLRVNAHMGNVSLANLGNARAAAVEATGGMGNLTADFGGEWSAGAVSDVAVDHSMGELVVRVPAEVRLQTAGASDAATAAAPAGGNQGDAADAPVMRLRLTTSMGGSRVIRY